MITIVIIKNMFWFWFLEAQFLHILYHILTPEGIFLDFTQNWGVDLEIFWGFGPDRVMQWINANLFQKLNFGPESGLDLVYEM